jgi:flagellar biosynthesis anti-sigma factor FlgM
MRIDDLNRTPLTQGTEKTDQAAEKRALEKTVTGDGTDKVDVSQFAQALATRDPARLEELRQAVQSGKYEVSAEAVAKSILNTHIQE